MMKRIFSAKRQKIESEIKIRSLPQCNDGEIDSTEVWRLVTQPASFLTTQELGRFLLLTSKSFVHAMYTQEEIWVTLLHARFTFDIVNLLKTQPISPKQLFFNLNKGEPKRNYPPLRELKYRPEDYLLLVNLFSSKGQAFYSKTISSSNDLKTFLEDGKIVLPMDVECPQVWQTMLDINVIIHLHRIPDQKTLCLFQSNTADWMDDNWLWLSIENDFIEMHDLEYARMLYSELDRHGCGQGIYLDVNLYTEYAGDREFFGCSCGLCYQGGKEICTSLSIDAQIRECDDDTPLDQNNLEDRGGVTFAHFIENAYGWSA